MIYLITGLPGASKTLNTIKMIDTEFKDRSVYYHNIPELTFDWQPLENPLLWDELPNKSVIVFDECQRIFPRRPNGSKVPKHIEALETHRHKGYDIILITQSPNLIDYHVRDLVGKHHHYQRNFGINKSTRFSWEQCQQNPEKSKYKAVKSVVNLDKKYFGTYKSSTDHTHKPKLPKKLFFILALGLASVGLLINTFANFNIYNEENERANIENQTGVIDENKPFFSLSSSQEKTITKEDYINSYTPRLADIPSSAPVYDELTKPKSYPVLNCISSVTRCECYSQQATKLFVSEKTCRFVVKNGYFDSAKENINSNRGGSERGRSDTDQPDPIDRYKRALQIRKEIAQNTY